MKITQTAQGSRREHTMGKDPESMSNSDIQFDHPIVPMTASSEPGHWTDAEKAEKRLQSVIDGTGVATWELNFLTGAAVFNEFWATIIGYSFKELQPIDIDTWRKYTYPDDIDKIDKKMQQHFAKMTDYFHADFRMKHKNGTWKWIRARGKVMEWTADGKPAWMLGTQYDITDLVTEREKCAELERFFAVNPELMAVLDYDANFIKLNSNWEEVLGFSTDELIKHGYLEFVHPDDMQATVSAISDLSGPTHQAFIINRYRTHNGEYRYLEWHAQTHGNRVYATARDITEIVKDENSLKANLDMKEKHVELMQMQGIGVGEFLDRTLEQIISSTKSKLGYIFIYNNDSQEFSLHSWSRAVMDECRVADKTRLYHLAAVGLWGEVVRQGKPVIVNDYQAPSPMQKGCPEGHVAISNFVSIPVFMNGAIVAVAAAANKSADYDQEDVLNLKLLMNTVWPVVERIKTDELRRNEKELLSATLLTVGVGIIVTDHSGCIVLLNPMAEQFSGYSQKEALGRGFGEIFHMMNLVTRENAPNPVLAGIKTTSSTPKDLGIISRDGSEIRLEGNTNQIRSEKGEITGFVISLKDISKEYEQEKEIEGFLNVNLDMLCVWDLNGNFHKVNNKFTEVTGYTTQEIEGKHFFDFIHEEDMEDTNDMLRKLANKEIVSGFVNRFRCSADSFKYIEWNTQPGVGKFLYSSARDVTDKHMKEQQLREIAIRDELTGQYNRHYFDMIIDDEMGKSDRYGAPLSMIILDLDHFKRVNDTWGHPVGDEQLKLTARIMENFKRDSDILIRFGGEEFVILLPQTTREGAAIAAEKIRAAIEESHHPVTGRQTASFGVAERMKSESFRHWYRRLDEALYRAKEGGRNQVAASDENEKLPFASVNIDWNTAWESGNPVIDKQHRELIEIGNRLINQSYAGMGQQEILSQLDRLLDHIMRHFKIEESILAAAGYPERIYHAETHKELIAKALRLKEAYRNKEIRTSAFFSFVVDDVILGHMVNTDMNFFPYTNGEISRKTESEISRKTESENSTEI